MIAFFPDRRALLGLVLFSAPLLAQTTPVPVFTQNMTSGIISFSAGQSTQINVLNLNPVPATTTAKTPSCTVEMEFRDASNNLLKQLTVPNVGPGDGASLTLDHSAVPVTNPPRFGVRGLVHSGALTPVASSGGNSMPIVGACSVLPTLEIFDDTTGGTRAVTSDFRSIATPIALPLSH